MKYCDDISMVSAKGGGDWTTFSFGMNNIISVNVGGLFMWSDNSWSNRNPFDISENGKLKIIGVDEG